MKKTTKKNILIGIVFLVVIASVVIFYKPVTNEFVGSCYIKQSSSTSNTYVCPTGGRCEVQGTTQCSQSTGIVQSVVFRTNVREDKFGNTSAWIAYGTEGTLKSFKLIASFGSTGGCRGNIYTPFKKYCVELTGSATSPQLKIYNTPTNGWIYGLGGNAELSPSPLEPYISNNQEVTSGSTTAYKCDLPVYVNDVQKETATYSGAIPGQLSTKTYQINGGDIFKFSGNINYKYIDDSKACSISKCNPAKTGYYNCPSTACPELSEVLTTCQSGTFCSDTSSGAKCIPPFESSYKYVDARGNTKMGYGLGEDIIFSYYIDSKTLTAASLVFDFMDVDNNIISSRSQSVNFPNSQTFSIQFSSPTQKGVGTYKVRVSVKYADKIITDGPYNIQISNPITSDIKASSESSGTILFANEPVIIEVNTYDQSGAATTADVDIKTATIEGNTLTYTKKESALGVYKFYYNVNQDGNLVIKSDAIKFGYVDTRTEEFLVKPAEIQVRYTNVENLRDIKPDSYIITFETKSPQGQYISTTNNIQMLTPGGEIKPVTGATGSNGKYQFTYNFEKEGGYQVIITSSASSYLTTDSYKSPLINVISNGGGVLECTLNTQCGVGYICKSSKCVAETPATPYILYLIIGISALAVIMLIVIIIRTRSKTSSQVQPGLIQ